MITRYPKNVPGDFYVEEGCCLTCAVPMTEAPEFFKMDDEQCYVIKQPANVEETDYLLDAIATQEVGCIRYAGNDKAVIMRMVGNGDGDSCDSPAAIQLLRTIVRLTHDAATPQKFLQVFIKSARKHAAAKQKRFNFGDIHMHNDAVHVDFTLYERLRGRLSIVMLESNAFKITLTGETGYVLMTADSIHNLLATVPVKDVWWMNQFEWDNGLGQRMPR